MVDDAAVASFAVVPGPAISSAVPGPAISSVVPALLFVHSAGWVHVNGRRLWRQRCLQPISDLKDHVDGLLQKRLQRPFRNTVNPGFPTPVSAR
jgi:hypothetical protein